MQVLAGGGEDSAGSASQVREQVGEDRDVPAGADGQRREELLEHAAEEAG